MGMQGTANTISSAFMAQADNTATSYTPNTGLTTVTTSFPTEQTGPQPVLPTVTLSTE